VFIQLLRWMSNAMGAVAHSILAMARETDTPVKQLGANTNGGV
jgi:hypothetical protein